MDYSGIIYTKEAKETKMGLRELGGLGVKTVGWRHSLSQVRGREGRVQFLPFAGVDFGSGHAQQFLRRFNSVQPLHFVILFMFN